MLHLATVRERDLEVGAAMEISEAVWRARDEGGAVHNGRRLLRIQDTNRPYRE